MHINAALDDLELEGDDRKSGHLLFAMLHAGTTNPDKIWKVAGLDRDFVRLRCKRLRENGVIPKPGHFVVEWFDDDWRIGCLGFSLDVMVAEGDLIRTGEHPDGRPKYQLTEQGTARARAEKATRRGSG